MAKIFISTNDGQPANCFEETIEKNAIRQYLTNLNFPTDSVKMVSNNVYLIFDKLDVLPEAININQDEDYLLYHNATKETVQNLFKVNRRKEGHHTEIAAHHYHTVFRTLIDDNIKDKFTKIITDVFPNADKQRLERQKTDFLYAIYNGQPIDKNDLPEFVKEVEDVVGTSIDWLSKNQYKISIDLTEKEKLTDEEATQGEIQRKHLIALRDALLST